MRPKVETGFLIKNSRIQNDIYIPRYYDPRIQSELASLEGSFQLLSLGDLVEKEQIKHDHGDYVPKIHYGTGPYPYIRTSDISNWELRASPKHGLSAEVFHDYAAAQDVRPRDILFVHEGTYLIGTSAMVTTFDGPMLYQHHLAKFRTMPNAKFSSYFLLAAFGSSIVQRQIRSKQFSADIIDSVVGRLEEVIIPIPRNAKREADISATTEAAVEGRARWRERISSFLRVLDRGLKSGDRSEIDAATKRVPQRSTSAEGQFFLGGREKYVSFAHKASRIVDDILIPKYYDPTIQQDLGEFSDACELVSIDTLVKRKLLSLSVGDEIGRLSYGTGHIPFVRTSDLATYELKADAKHGVETAIWEQYRNSQNVAPGDILLVRDGTYLVGSSALLFEQDLPLLFCGGIYKLSFPEPEILSPSLCYALLNLSIVRRQMRSKQFTRDVIDTLGHRLREVVLPLPNDKVIRGLISEFVQHACEQRIRLRAQLQSLCGELFRPR